jgi:hypothetical protein
MKLSFKEATEGLDKNSPKYQLLLHEEIRQRKQLDADKKNMMYKHRMSIKIMQLLAPVKQLNVSKLDHVERDKLIEIGKLSSELYEALKKANLLNRL